MIRAFILFICLSCPILCLAKGRIFPVLEANPSARNAAMGNAVLGDAKDMYLYVNPAAFVFSQKQVAVDFSTELYSDTDNGRLIQYNAAAGFKLNAKTAVLLGFRTQRGYTIPTTSATVAELKPYEWTLDFGSAFEVIPNIVAYASGSYVRSVVTEKAEGWTLSAGISYQNELEFFSRNSTLNIGVRFLDSGKSVKYGDTGLPYDLPTSVALGGSLDVELSKEHKLVYALSGRYFTPTDAEELYIGTGVEYIFKDLVALRLGYQDSKDSSSRFTFGLGVAYANTYFNISYGNTTEVYGENTLMLGVGLEL